MAYFLTGVFTSLARIVGVKLNNYFGGSDAGLHLLLPAVVLAFCIIYVIRNQKHNNDKKD